MCWSYLYLQSIFYIFIKTQCVFFRSNDDPPNVFLLPLAIFIIYQKNPACITLSNNIPQWWATSVTSCDYLKLLLAKIRMPQLNTQEKPVALSSCLICPEWCSLNKCYKLTAHLTTSSVQPLWHEPGKTPVNRFYRESPVFLPRKPGNRMCTVKPG